MGDNYEWELSKENIQPLKHGRNICNLVSALSMSEDHTKQHRNEQSKALELAIMSYEGNDPLELWNHYIQWVEENYPQGGKEGDLLTILEKCLEKLKDSSQYQSDQRLLDIYLRYLDLTDNSVEWFQMLYAGGYFHQLSTFYINWAEKLEVSFNYKEATKVYQLGLQNNAEPSCKLDESFKKYQARVANAVFKGLTQTETINEPVNNENRHAFGELEPVTEDHKIPTIRSGAVVRKFQSNRLLPSVPKMNRPLAIHEDENNPSSTPVLISGKISIPIHSTIKSENHHKAGKWNESHGIVQEVVPGTSQPKIQVHVDEEISVQSHRKADFSLALRDKPVAIHKLNPQTLFENENPKVRLMCDLNKIYVANREFSYEEIRRQCYERNGRFSSVKPTSVSKISSSTTTPVAFKTPSSKTPVLKPKTPSNDGPLVEGENSKNPATFNPNEHLKPNERLHCNVDLIFNNETEFSFEQIRAKFYASKIKESSPVPSAEKVHCKAPVVLESQESSAQTCLPPPSTKTPPTTREISVQTDLFGLDYDIQLVPRKPVVSSPPSVKTPSPRSFKDFDQPSPTVNTRQALSSVKSWFNNSVLIEPRADVKKSETSKKSLFAIFKDSSMVDGKAPEGLEDAAQSGTAKKGLFTIYSEPSFSAIEKVQPPKDIGRKPFAILEEKEPVYADKISEPFAILDDNLPVPVAILDENDVKPTKFIKPLIFADENDSKIEKRFTAMDEADRACSKAMKPFTIMDENNVDAGDIEPVKNKLKVRKALAAIESYPEENPECCGDDVAQTPDNFKENVPPSAYVQSKVKRQLSGILTASVGIEFDPKALIDNQEPEAVGEHTHQPISRALFADAEDETRHYGIPLSDNIDDFTVPSAMAFARNCRIQSTPMIHQKPIVFDEDLTSVAFNLPKNKLLASSAPGSNEDESAVKSETALAALKIRRGLSPIDEISREYFSSSGSSAGTTGLAHSRLSVGRSLHSHCVDTAIRVFPTSYDPFDLDVRNTQLTSLSLPLESRSGFHAIPGRLPWLRSNSSVQLGGTCYIVKQSIGQGAYAKIYEAFQSNSTDLNPSKSVLKVQDLSGIWEFYITSEMHRRLGDSPVAQAVMNIRNGYFYDSGSILVDDLIPHGTLLDLINHYRLKNSSMPESLVFYFAIQLLTMVHQLHECSILHADIKADNIMLQGVPVLPDDDWVADDITGLQKPSLKLIDFGRSLDLTLFPERSCFMHCFQDDRCPEMRDNKPWNFQLDYYGLACTIYSMLMGIHCKVYFSDSQWKVPNLKRGHNNVWRELTTALLNSSSAQVDLTHFRNVLTSEFLTSVRPRDFNDRLRELERYLMNK